jgi:hypothetical protein
VAKRAFAFRIYGLSRTGRTASTTAVPGLADTEEDGGSTPSAPAYSL